jgi:peptidoglycan/LPS O-acetylase OafA/YrhL
LAYLESGFSPIINKKGKNILISIQYLRAIAILLVICTHLGYKDNQYGSGVFNFNIGIIGVDIFFVISGFIMYYIMNDRGNGYYIIKSFLKHRIIRIIPLYWVLTTLALIMFFIFSENLSRTTETGILNSYFLYPSEYEKYLDPAWTLSYEFYFYFLFSIGLLFKKNRIIIVSSFLILFYTLSYMLPYNNAMMQFLSNSIVFEFIYGMIIAYIYIHTKQNKIKISIISILIFIILIFLYFIDIQTGIRALDFGIPSMFIVLSFIMIDEILQISKIKTLESIGNISYSLYLSHAFILAIIGVLYNKIKIHTLFSEILFIMTMFFSSLIFGYIIYIYLEKKLISYFKKKYK